MVNKLELLIRHTGRMLAENQAAYLFKIPEALTATPVDFFGYTKDGRAILIEAKDVARASLPIGNSPGLAPHQWNALKDAGRANCLSLICWKRGPVLATIDIEMAVALSQNRQSIPWRLIPEEFLHQDLRPSNCLDLLRPYINSQQASSQNRRQRSGPQ